MTPRNTNPPASTSAMSVSPATSSDPALPSWRRWSALAVLSASLLTVTMDLTILNVALPSISADLRPSSTEQLWMIDVYSLVLAGLLVTMSGLADRWGRRRLLLLGFALFGAASVLVLWADSPTMVIAVRALLGLGGAMIMPTTLSMLRVVFTVPRERTLALSVWAAVSAVGTALGPIVGGLLLEAFSWHAAFLINVPMMAVGFVAGALILPESRVPSVGRWDVLASTLSVVGMVALVWAIKQFGKGFSDQGFADRAAWLALAVAVVALSAFVFRCLRNPHPLLEVRLFTRRPLTAGVLTAFFSMLAMGGGLLLVAQWLQLVQGHGPLAAGVRLLPFAGGAVITSLLAQRAVDALGARTVLALGLWCAAAGFLLLGVAPSPITYPWAAVAMALQGAGAGALAIASAMIMTASPPEAAGNAAAIEETSYDLGNVFGVALLGTIAAVIFQTKVGGGEAGESLAAALQIAANEGSEQAAALANSAFVDSLATVGMIGSVILAVAGGLVLWLTPRGIDIDTQQH